MLSCLFLLILMSYTISKTITKAASKTKTTLASAPSSSQIPLKVLNWNIDGLQVDADLQKRMSTVARKIRICDADVVCLQEVTGIFQPRLEKELSGAYYFFPQPNDDSHMPDASYYTMILTKKSSIEVMSYGRKNFKESRSMMGRDLLSLLFRKIDTGRRYSCPILITTSHLESQAQYKDTRKEQYRELLQLLKEKNDSLAQIACGDFNLRVAEDKEIRNDLGLGKVEESSQSDVKDTYYVICGKNDKELKNTWARMGASFNGGAFPVLMQARFDRQLFSGKGIEVSQKGFNLIGKDKTDYLSEEIEKERGYSTPSDHFGLVVDYFVNEV